MTTFEWKTLIRKDNLVLSWNCGIEWLNDLVLEVDKTPMQKVWFFLFTIHINQTLANALIYLIAPPILCIRFHYYYYSYNLKLLSWNLQRWLPRPRRWSDNEYCLRIWKISSRCPCIPALLFSCSCELCPSLYISSNFWRRSLASFLSEPVIDDEGCWGAAAIRGFQLNSLHLQVEI